MCWLFTLDTCHGDCGAGLCRGVWSHAEYLSLVRSSHDGVCFDRIEPAFQRYVVDPVKHTHEMWSFHHSICRMSPGRSLRLIVEEAATIVWSVNDWARTTETEATQISALNQWFADLATENCSDGTVIQFYFRWKEAQRSQSRNYSVVVKGNNSLPMSG